MKYFPQSVLYSLLVYVLSFSVVLIIQQFVPHFFDYEGYTKYIEVQNLALLRFRSEPISALIMHVLCILKLSAYEFYFICNSMLALSVIKATKEFKQLRILLIILILFSPLSLISYLTPRQVLATSFIIWGVSSNTKYSKYFWFLAAFLSHNATGLLGGYFYFLYNIKFKYSIVCILGLYILVAIIMKGIIPSSYMEVYSEQISSDRGNGRLLLLNVLAFFFLLLKQNEKVFIGILCAIVVTGIHLNLAPIGGRIIGLLFPIIILSSFKKIKNRANYAMFMMFVLLNIITSLYILENGLYGYG